MTVQLDTFTFPIKPGVTIGSEVELAEKKLFLGGTTKEYTGRAPIFITLEGEFVDVNCYTDRDTLMALIAEKKEKIDFYADDIDYGSSGTPKSVWIRGFNFTQPRGEKDSVSFQIILEEET
jgi:hypothetical protein